MPQERTFIPSGLSKAASHPAPAKGVITARLVNLGHIPRTVLRSFVAATSITLQYAGSCL
jgi:hypothetical protein